MGSPATVRFNEPPVTQYDSMDVDDSTEFQISTDQLYLGPDDDTDSYPVSSSGPDVLSFIPDQSPPGHADQPGLPIYPDLYLRPEDNLMPEIPTQSDVTNADLLSMVLEFWPFGSYHHTGLQSIQDRLDDYRHQHGNLPDPYIQQLLEAERPF
ncbi:uncharacterized protein HD556DRAFT_1437866 [Suillus plorans]|uniref:Uncharacterized protein n=1 Tax=Suillus plorans TaxID=116603 RepID=A0A9P7J4T1_9AGAM|nr:uncharacterized protein HD556DRAFT_1437866 [Suillus plorans]KAG1802804.1 hypothetical protein HD556DRAFT_1437866 [Suillus plorans]